MKKALLIAGLLYFVFVSIWAVAEVTKGKQSVVAVMMDTKDLMPRCLKSTVIHTEVNRVSATQHGLVIAFQCDDKEV